MRGGLRTAVGLEMLAVVDIFVETFVQKVIELVEYLKCLFPGGWGGD
ncbi:hypothetical protein [Paenibacillus wynnii]|nr:hypothetical protein [Paenibacillus wynnii]MDQ0194151.1 hypothetical protein [Paenibacillus wynnii]